MLPSLFMDKNILRNKAKEIRSSLSKKDREVASPLLQKNIEDYLKKTGHAQNVIATYYPIGTEISPPHALPWAQMALPVIRESKMLEFYPWSPSMRLVKRDFNIPIPDTRGLTPVRPDVILLPLLLCDRHGNRIGYGAGHYDRTIETIAPAPLLIGLCFDEQIYEGKIPAEEHDQPLDVIITPKRILIPQPSSSPRR